MCSGLKKAFPMGGLNIATQLYKHAPQFKAIEPLGQAAKFVSRGGMASAMGRSLFGE